MLAQFYYNAVQTGTEEGIPVYEDKVFVKITRDVTHTVNREAEEGDFVRFPGEFAYFQRQTAKYEPIEGCLPLEFWPVASPADVANLKGHGIRSVQDLAKADPKKMPSVFSTLCDLSRSYLEIAGAAAKASQMMADLKAENKQLREDLGLARADADALRRAMSKEKAA